MRPSPRWPTVFIWLVVASQVLLLLGYLGLTGAANGFTAQSMARFTFFSWVALMATWIGAGVAWMRWAWKARKLLDANVGTAAAHTRTAWRYSSKALVGWWFVPLASWWIPRSVHLELFGALMPSTDSRSVRRMVNRWWGWLVTWSILDVGFLDAIIGSGLGLILATIAAAIAARHAVTLIRESNHYLEHELGGVPA